MSIKLPTKYHNLQFPIFVEKDEDGFYVAESPDLEGCYSQGKTLDEVLKNIKKVIEIVLEEKEEEELKEYAGARELSLHTITI